MRISDWSSDVCSSDLQDPMIKDNPLDPRNRRIAILLLSDVPKAGAAGGGAGGTAAGKTDGPLRPGPLRLPPPPPPPPRSEEHTSELQSLMRISYAVFCLNKKTHKNTNNTQEHTSYDNQHTHQYN